MKRYKAIPEFYDAESADIKMLQHDVPFFLGQMPKKRQSVLELAVGTARAAIPIAQAGHRVTGIDYDRNLLAIATQKRDAVGLKERELSLLPGDVLDFDLGRTFDWVCIFFNTLLAFPTLDEQDRVLQGIRRHLKPRGRLWIDIFQPDLAHLARPMDTGLDPRMFHVPQMDRTVFQTTDVRRDVAKQIQEITFNYSWFDDFGEVHRRQNRFAMTWIFPRELELLLERNGLWIEELWGNYDGSGLKSESPRMIVRCMKS